MLNTSASGSASPVVSTTIMSGSTRWMISFTAASNSPSNEQQTQPPPSSAILTFLPSMTFVSIAISAAAARSEEHTSELQSQSNLVCRLLLEKKKKKYESSVECL